MRTRLARLFGKIPEAEAPPRRREDVASAEDEPDTEDETAYLLRSPANRERLLRAIKDAAEGRTHEVDLDELLPAEEKGLQERERE